MYIVALCVKKEKMFIMRVFLFHVFTLTFVRSRVLLSLLFILWWKLPQKRLENAPPTFFLDTPLSEAVWPKSWAQYLKITLNALKNIPDIIPSVHRVLPWGPFLPLLDEKKLPKTGSEPRFTAKHTTTELWCQAYNKENCVYLATWHRLCTMPRAWSCAHVNSHALTRRMP